MKRIALVILVTLATMMTLIGVASASQKGVWIDAVRPVRIMSQPAVWID